MVDIEQQIASTQTHPERIYLEYLLALIRKKTGTRAQQNAVKRLLYARPVSTSITTKLSYSIKSYSSGNLPQHVVVDVHEALESPEGFR